MRNLLLLWTLFLVGWGYSSGVRAGTFNDSYDAYACYGYQPCYKWRAVREANYGGKENVLLLQEKLEQSEGERVICPWWIEDLYKQLPPAAVARLQQISYAGYVLNPWTGAPRLVNEWNNSRAVVDDTLFRELPLELVVYCRSAGELDIFLSSEAAQLRFLEMVFAPDSGAIHRKYGRNKPEGINFYFPEVSFRKKKALIRFTKSVKMVIDAFETEGERPYAEDKCRFYMTFSPDALGETEFISGLLTFVDAVYFAEYDDYGVAVDKPFRLDRASDDAPLSARIRNQFYLLHSGGSRPDVLEKGSSDFAELMRADYTTDDWQLYFYIDLGLVFLLLLLVVLYGFSSSFYMLAMNWRMLIAPVLIALFGEIVIVLLFMLESFSRETLFIDMNHYGHYFLLALPLVFIAINIFFRAFNRNDAVP